MRKLMLTALLAATLMPAAASAQSNAELRRDRQDIRSEQRDLRDARRFGDRRDIRDRRGDLRDARQEYREDLRDRGRAFGRNDWRGGRERNPGFYNRGTWNAPFRYNTFRPGARISSGFYGSRYVIADPWRYRLRRPAYGQRWIRHYNDVILVNTRRGVVVDVNRGFYR